MKNFVLKNLETLYATGAMSKEEYELIKNEGHAGRKKKYTPFVIDPDDLLDSLTAALAGIKARWPDYHQIFVTINEGRVCLRPSFGANDTLDTIEEMPHD